MIRTTMSSRDALIFLHIPKTAGMTLRALLASRYPARHTFVIGNDINADIERFVTMDDDSRARIRLLMGHMSFGLHRFLPTGARYVTMLRDPVERVLSEYRFLKRNTLHPFHSRVASMSIHDYLESGFTGQSSNGQTRLLSGSHEPGRPGIAGREPLDEHHLARALGALDRHFLVAGIQERFDESLLLVSRALGWRLWPFFVSRNVTTRSREAADVRIDDGEEVRAAIAERNQLDIGLYGEVSRRLDHTIREAGVGFSKAAGRFVFLNRLYQHTDSRVIQYRRRILRTFHR